MHGELNYITYTHTSAKGGFYNPNAVFGKGLINAYAKAEAQDWAGAVIDQSVVDFMDTNGMNITILDEFARRYRVPYKVGLADEEEFVFRIYKGQLNNNAFENISRSITAGFNSHNKSIDEPSIQKKIGNTISFFESVRTYENWVDEDEVKGPE